MPSASTNNTNHTINTIDNDMDINVSPVQTGDRDTHTLYFENDTCLTNWTTRSLDNTLKKNVTVILNGTRNLFLMHHWIKRHRLSWT